MSDSLRELMAFRKYVVDSTWNENDPIEMLYGLPIVKLNKTPLVTSPYGVTGGGVNALFFKEYTVVLNNNNSGTIGLFTEWNIYSIKNELFKYLNLDISSSNITPIEQAFSNTRIQIISNHGKILPLKNVFVQATDTTNNSVCGDILFIIPNSITSLVLDKISITGDHDNIFLSVCGNPKNKYTSASINITSTVDYPNVCKSSDIIVHNGVYKYLLQSSANINFYNGKDSYLQIYETDSSPYVTKLNNINYVRSHDFNDNGVIVPSKIIHLQKPQDDSFKILHIENMDVFIIKTISGSVFAGEGYCINNDLYKYGYQCSHRDIIIPDNIINKYKDILGVQESELSIVIYAHESISPGEMLDTRNRIHSLYKNNTDSQILDYLSKSVNSNSHWFWSATSLANNKYIQSIKYTTPKMVDGFTLQDYIKSFGFNISSELLCKKIFIIDKTSNESIDKITIKVPPYFYNKKIECTVQEVSSSPQYQNVLSVDNNTLSEKINIEIENFNIDKTYCIEIFEVLPSSVTIIPPGKNRTILRKHKDYRLFKLTRINSLNSNVFKWKDVVVEKTNFNPNEYNEEFENSLYELENDFLASSGVVSDSGTLDFYRSKKIYSTKKRKMNDLFNLDTENIWNEFEVTELTEREIYGLNRYIEHVCINNVAYIFIKPEHENTMFAVSFGGGYIHKKFTMSEFESNKYLAETVTDYFDDGTHIKELFRNKQNDSAFGKIDIRPYDFIDTVNKDKTVNNRWNDINFWNDENAWNDLLNTNSSCKTGYFIPRNVAMYQLSLTSKVHTTSNQLGMFENKDSQIFLSDHEAIVKSISNQGITIIDYTKESIEVLYELIITDTETSIVSFTYRKEDNILFVLDSNGKLYSYLFTPVSVMDAIDSNDYSDGNITIEMFDTAYKYKFVKINEINIGSILVDTKILLLKNTDYILIESESLTDGHNGLLIEFGLNYENIFTSNFNIIKYIQNIYDDSAVYNYQKYMVDIVTGRVFVYSYSEAIQSFTIGVLNTDTFEIENITNFNIVVNKIVCSRNNIYVYDNSNIYRILYNTRIGFKIDNTKYIPNVIIKNIYVSDINTLLCVCKEVDDIAHEPILLMLKWNINSVDGSLYGISYDTPYAGSFDNGHLVLTSKTKGYILFDNSSILTVDIENTSQNKECIHLLDKDVPLPKFIYFNGELINSEKLLYIDINDKILKDISGLNFEVIGIKISYPYDQNFEYTDHSLFTIVHHGNEYIIDSFFEADVNKDKQVSLIYDAEVWDKPMSVHRKYMLEKIRIGSSISLIDWSISYDNSLFIPLKTINGFD